LQEASEELLKEATDCLDALEKGLAAWEVQRLLSGPFDAGPAVLTIQAGAGGDDAMDWAEMLERMYMRWFEARGWSVQEIHRVVGEVAGIKSADYEVRGRYAFGLLYAEKGTHRLVRQSPFNAKAARQTSFAAVDVAPLLNEVFSASAAIEPFCFRYPSTCKCLHA
jgi:peptide chain release factor 2